MPLGNQSQYQHHHLHQPPPSATIPQSQPSPPARHNNTSAVMSSSSSPLSPTMSPVSPTSRSFFGAITERVRSGRSRSRSPAPQTQSSRITPESKMQWPSQGATDRPQGARTFSGSSAASASAVMERTTSSGSTERSQWDSMAYGRHSSDWLFKSQKTLKRQSTSDSSNPY